MRGWPRTEIAQKEPAHGHQWTREGHPDATPQEKVQVKLEAEEPRLSQNREEWGHHVPNRIGMGKWKEDHARTSQQEDHCWVEEQAPVE